MTEAQKRELSARWHKLHMERDTESRKINASQAIMGSIEWSIAKLEDRLSADDVDPREYPHEP